MDQYKKHRLVKLHPPSKIGSHIPPSLFTHLRYVIANGRELAQKYLIPEPHLDFPKALNKQLQNTRLFSSCSYPTHELLLFGLYHGICEAILHESEDNESILDTGFKFGALSEQRLIQAFLWLPINTRWLLYKKNEEIRENISDWYRRLVGGEAVAAVARILTQMGYFVFLPTPQEDTEYKIDLICADPIREHYLCLQIKALGSSEKVWSPNIFEAKESRSYFFRFYRGVTNFNLENGGKYQPLYIEIGFKGIMLGAFQENHCIRESIQSIVHDHLKQKQSQVA